MALDSLPCSSRGARGSFEGQLRMLAEAGFEGVQFGDRATPSQLVCCRSLGMRMAASGRVNTPAEAAPFAEQCKEDGYECATLHVGWGLEDDSQTDALVESVLQASADWNIPLYIETHRATICQDMWRTVQLVKRYPALRFNGDFSHWYAGQEMVYGGFENKLAFIQPVIERVRFLHGRIANPGCIQVALDGGSNEAPLYVDHFRQLWTACFRAFLEHEDSSFLCFTPELLGSDIYYARTFQGAEESDRWTQSLLLKKMAVECFESAQSC